MSKVMIKLKGLFLLLISVMVLNGCQTPTDTSSPTHTELEVRNNSGNVDTWFVYGVDVNGKSLYNYTYGTEIRHGEWRKFSFTKDDVGGDLTDVDVELKLQITNGSTLRESVSLNIHFILGERRVVRVDCVSLYNNKWCRTDGLVLTLVE